MYGKLCAIVTNPGKMGYGSYARLVIYSQQLLEPGTWCHKRNGGACKPRPSPTASMVGLTSGVGSGGNFRCECAATWRPQWLLRPGSSVSRLRTLTGVKRTG